PPFPRPHPLPDLPSFPTRRSSDLETLLLLDPPRDLVVCHHLQRDGRSTRLAHCCVCSLHEPTTDALTARLGQHIEAVNVADAARSEEHTSELESRFDLVCRLLLEK